MDQVDDSQPSSPENNEELSHHVESVGEASVIISSAQMEHIFHSWYYIKEDFEHAFPDQFCVVPTANVSDRLWRDGMDFKDVVGRLLEKIENNSHDNLIPPIMGYSNDVVETATKKFADPRRRLQLNKHHLEVLRKMKSNGKMPRYLKLETPKIKAELFCGINDQVSGHSEASEWRSFGSHYSGAP